MACPLGDPARALGCATAAPSIVIPVAAVLARLAVPLLIPLSPLPAILAALVLDAADQTIFAATLGGELAGYQSYDKALDIYYLGVFWSRC